MIIVRAGVLVSRSVPIIAERAECRLTGQISSEDLTSCSQRRNKLVEGHNHPDISYANLNINSLPRVPLPRSFARAETMHHRNIGTELNLTTSAIQES